MGVLSRKMALVSYNQLKMNQNFTSEGGSQQDQAQQKVQINNADLNPSQMSDSLSNNKMQNKTTIAASNSQETLGVNIKVSKGRNLLVKNPILKKKYAEIVMERKKMEAGIDGRLDYRPFEVEAHNMFSDDVNMSAIDR